MVWSKVLLASLVFLDRWLKLIKHHLQNTRIQKKRTQPKIFVCLFFLLQISAFRASLTDVATYGHIPVPLVYTQVRKICIKGTFFWQKLKICYNNEGISAITSFTCLFSVGCHTCRLHSLCRIADRRAVAFEVKVLSSIHSSWFCIIICLVFCIIFRIIFCIIFCILLLSSSFPSVLERPVNNIFLFYEQF